MGFFISKVTSRGQVTLPQEMREEEGITSDDYVAIRKVGSYIVIGKAELRLDDITKEFGRAAKVKGVTKAALLEELDAVRKSRK